MSNKNKKEKTKEENDEDELLSETMERINLRMATDPLAFSRAMSEGPDLLNKGNAALRERKYATAVGYFHEAVKVFDEGWGPSSYQVSHGYIGLCEAYMGLKMWPQAEKYAQMLKELAETRKEKENVEVANELFEDIKQAKAGKKRQNKTNEQNENKDPMKETKGDSSCAVCKADKAKYRCGKCQMVNYCSSDCQRSDWPKHKPTCSSASTTKSDATEPKPACGLCGFEGSRSIKIVKTQCCNNWICDDEHTYAISTYLLNSCRRNHSRYTLCEHHYVDEKHRGKLAECAACNVRQCHTCECPQAAWQRFAEQHFLFENVTGKEKKRNRQLKTDGTKAFVSEFPLQFN